MGSKITDLLKLIIETEKRETEKSQLALILTSSRSYFSELKNPFLCRCVCNNLKHALVVSFDDAVRRLGILTDVAVICFHLATLFP